MPYLGEVRCDQCGLTGRVTRQAAGGFKLEPDWENAARCDVVVIERQRALRAGQRDDIGKALDMCGWLRKKAVALNRRR